MFPSTSHRYNNCWSKCKVCPPFSAKKNKTKHHSTRCAEHEIISTAKLSRYYNKSLGGRWRWEQRDLEVEGSFDSISVWLLRCQRDVEGVAQPGLDWWGSLYVHTDLPGHHGNHPTETRPPAAQPITASLNSLGQWGSRGAEV